MDANETVTEELNAIVKKYSLGELILPIEHLTNGWTNLTFKFRTKPDEKTYVLRIYLPGILRNISQENIRFEVDFLRYLSNELHLPVAPLIDPPGLLTMNNANLAAIFPFIHGRKYLDSPETPVRQLWQTLEISRFLGRMHSNIQTKEYPLQPSNRRSINFISIKYELVNCCPEFAKEHPDLYERIRSITDRYTSSIPLIEDEDEQNRFEKNFEKDLPVGYIHADIHDDNVLFDTSEQRLAAVLDFDDMYIGPLLIDLAMTLCLWCAIGSQLRMDYIRECLIVYQTERKMSLTDSEWNLLEIYCYLTILNQILFTIEADRCARPRQNMINELLLPIEHLAKQREMFLEIIQTLK